MSDYNNYAEINRLRADKRKCDKSIPNLHRKKVKNKEHKRNTKYSHLTDRERKVIYREKARIKNNENYRNNLEKAREQRRQYYYNHKETILEQHKQKRLENAKKKEKNITINKIGRPCKY
jgi:hypothetical protein